MKLKMKSGFIEEIPSIAAQSGSQIVTFSGWVQHLRSSGKIKFLVMRDGTGWLQCVFMQGSCSATVLEHFETLTQESSIEIKGQLQAQPRAPGGYELMVTDLKILSLARDYPITPKEHGVEFLMEHRHLWVRSTRQWAALRIRAAVIRILQKFFDDAGFIRFDAPILTPSACEGTSTLFSTNYFDDQAYLTQSGQLYGEVGAMAFGKVYVFGPTFRAEKSKTRKHLTEFWMLEPELAFADLEDVMQLAEEMVEHTVHVLLESCAQEFKLLNVDPKRLEGIRGAFPRITYDEALKILEKRGSPIPWGEDFGAPHESILGAEFGKPVFVHHMPASIKAFYFKQSSEAGRCYALGCDLIAPDGYGEIIGGGQREDQWDVLKMRLQEHHLTESDYEWYLDLRKYGSVPHAGFGMGLERFVAWMTGVEHVRETIPFPRMLNLLRP